MEAAFALPIFMLMVLAIVEFGLYMNDDLAVSSAVRAGSRMASASGDSKLADLYTVNRIGKEAAALDRGNIKRIVIFRPTAVGAAAGKEVPSVECRAGTPVDALCNVYTPADFSKAAAQIDEINDALAEGREPDPAKMVFGCSDGAPDASWCPTTRKVGQKDNGGKGTDYIGVWIEVEHPWVTRMFGTSTTITDQSVVRLEPRSIGAT